MGYISLLTDFGIRDANVGVMKGVIWRIAPEAKIADLSHTVDPQNIRQAAYLLERSVFYFPQGAIHVVVVDPGVGTERRPIAAQIGSQLFVAPDNGVLTAVLARAEREGWQSNIVHLDNSKYWLSQISDVFHGRDIFSPVGAHLANGIPLEELGSLIDDPVRIPLPQPLCTAKKIMGEVIYIDHFGNVASNIHREDFAGMGDVEVSICAVKIEGVVRTFGEGSVGELIALYSSTDYLFVAEVNGNAAKRISARIGDAFEVRQR